MCACVHVCVSMCVCVCVSQSRNHAILSSIGKMPYVEVVVSVQVHKSHLRIFYPTWKSSSSTGTIVRATQSAVDC